MGVWLGPMGGGEGKAPSFTITKNGSPATLNADYLYAENTVNGVVNWELAILTECVIKFSRVGLVDIALVAGGENGYSGGSGLGGYGGGGGEVVEEDNSGAGIKLKRGVNYKAGVGAGEADTTFEEYESGSYTALYTADYGQGGDGGTPSSTRGVDPVAGDDGTKIWSGSHEISSLVDVKFGAGGGAGGFCSADYSVYLRSKGGATGGGDGGVISWDAGTQQFSSTDGGTGTANRGAGGGGAWYNAVNSSGGAVGSGGSGIIIIRNHREV